MKIKQFKSLASHRLILAAAAGLLLTGAHARTWASADGARTFDGELRSYDPAKGSVTVTLANGKAMTYPGAKEYEVAGFFWWQGDKDMRNPAHFEQYEKNLIQLIKSLRKDFNAPDAKFVTASLGQTQKGSKGGDGVILDAMESVSKSSDPELKGKVAFVYTHPLSKGGSSSGHYGGNPETYMNVGEAMGKAMVGLLQGK